MVVYQTTNNNSWVDLFHVKIKFFLTVVVTCTKNKNIHSVSAQTNQKQSRLIEMFKSLFLICTLLALAVYIPRLIAQENGSKNTNNEWNVIMVSDMDKNSKEIEKENWFSHIQVRFFFFFFAPH